MLDGITPADAGKTHKARFNRQRKRDHPRGCGENDGRGRVGIFTPGSPPRMRGKRKDEITKFFEDRITPADAGKTQI